MKTFLLVLPAVICAIMAAGLAVRGVEGWGWFLFASVVIAGVAAQYSGGAV